MDLIKEGTDGFLVEFGNVEDLRGKIRILMDDNNLRRRQGSSGRHRALKNYTWAVITDKIERRIKMSEISI